MIEEVVDEVVVDLDIEDHEQDQEVKTVKEDHEDLQVTEGLCLDPTLKAKSEDKAGDPDPNLIID